MIKYGLISETDARCLEKTIDLILNEFDLWLTLGIKPYNPLEITEIGLFDCGTANGISEYLTNKCIIRYTGIDNEKDKQINAPDWMRYINGNSNEVYNQLEDNSQHLIFVDGCHCFAHVVSDFFCYASKVKVGGYLAFHDTGKHIKPFKDFQHGDKANPDAYISVRKALEAIGMFGKPVDIFIGKRMSLENVINFYYDTGILLNKPQSVMFHYPGWQLVFDEADETNEAGGICVFKKLY